MNWGYVMFAVLVVLAVAVAVVLHRYRRSLFMRGKVMKVRLIGGPMDGRDVLGVIGGTYWNYKPIDCGWEKYRYDIVAGGWGVYRGSLMVPFMHLGGL